MAGPQAYLNVEIQDVGGISLREDQYDEQFKTEMQKYVKIEGEGEGNITITEEKFGQLKSQIASDFGIEEKEKKYTITAEEKSDIQVIVKKGSRSSGAGGPQAYFNIEIQDVGTIKELLLSQYEKQFKKEMKKYVKIGKDRRR